MGAESFVYIYENQLGTSLGLRRKMRFSPDDPYKGEFLTSPAASLDDLSSNIEAHPNFLDDVLIEAHLEGYLEPEDILESLPEQISGKDFQRAIRYSISDDLLDTVTERKDLILSRSLMSYALQEEDRWSLILQHMPITSGLSVSVGNSKTKRNLWSRLSAGRYRLLDELIEQGKEEGLMRAENLVTLPMTVDQQRYHGGIFSVLKKDVAAYLASNVHLHSPKEYSRKERAVS